MECVKCIRESANTAAAAAAGGAVEALGDAAGAGEGALPLTTAALLVEEAGDGADGVDGAVPALAGVAEAGAGAIPGAGAGMGSGGFDS